MKRDLLRLVKRYRVPITTLNKEVLIDEELLEEASRYIDQPVTVPYAFPGFIFRWLQGFALETEERRLNAVKEEYKVLGDLFNPPYFPLVNESIYLEPDYRFSRDSLMISLLHQPKRLVVVTRESVLLSLIAEPGWREYSPITVISGLFYTVDDVFRLSNDSFYPPGKSSMGMAFIRLRRPYLKLDAFYRFLKQMFIQRKKKVKIGHLKMEKRVDQLSPEELLELFETTLTG